MNSPVDRNLADQIVHILSGVCEMEVDFMNSAGIILGSTDETRAGFLHESGYTAADREKFMETDPNADCEDGQRWIHVPVYHNQSLAAVIGLFGNPKEARKYADLAGEITLLLLREGEAGRGRRLGEEKGLFVLHSLIGEEVFNPHYLNQCLKEAGFPDHTPKRLILVRLDGSRGSTDRIPPDSRVEELFQSVYPAVYTRIVPGDYLCLIEDDSLPAFLPFLRTFTEEYGSCLKASVGKRSALRDLKQSYQSARTALRTIQDSPAALALFDDLCLELILSDIKKDTERAYLEKTIGKLDTQELEFLKVYFEENLSLTETASRTFLHKNTVQYRLNRIAAKTGLNPRIFRDAVHFFLAIHMKTATSGQDTESSQKN